MYNKYPTHIYEIVSSIIMEKSIFVWSILPVCLYEEMINLFLPTVNIVTINTDEAHQNASNCGVTWELSCKLYVTHVIYCLTIPEKEHKIYKVLFHK